MGMGSILGAYPMPRATADDSNDNKFYNLIVELQSGHSLQ